MSAKRAEIMAKLEEPSSGIVHMFIGFYRITAFVSNRVGIYLGSPCPIAFPRIKKKKHEFKASQPFDVTVVSPPLSGNAGVPIAMFIDQSFSSFLLFEKDCIYHNFFPPKHPHAHAHIYTEISR